MKSLVKVALRQLFPLFNHPFRAINLLALQVVDLKKFGEMCISKRKSKQVLAGCNCQRNITQFWAFS